MNINAIDLFCGVGGLTHGLEQAGINVIAGIDNEESCRVPYEANNNSKFILKDIKEVTAQEVQDLYPPETDIKILAGCAPCQPFSTYSYRYKNSKTTGEKMDLLKYFSDLVQEILPEVVSMENVPQMTKTPIFEDFLSILKSLNYNIDWRIVYAPDYEVPQNRKRLILIASRIKPIKLIEPTRSKNNYLTVKDIISELPSLLAGGTDPEDSLHTCRNLTTINLERIKQSKPGGTWKDWEENLLPNCYRKKSGQSYGSVYGRIDWDKPSPTITTQFIGYGNGRFGHPEQNRALSLREGAMLQTFPRDYKFLNKETFSTKNIAIQIGNAVPVKLGYAIGKSIFDNFNKE